MSDYLRELWDPAAGWARADEKERPKLRQVSEEELKKILAEHLKWLESVKEEEEEALEQRLRKFMEESTWDKRPGANLQETILKDVELQETEIQKTKLQWANVRKANLQRSDFRCAELHHTLFFKSDLRKADLRDANLAKADLQQADLRKAQLLGTNLREANLQDADLRDVTGLLGKQLAGANVSGAKLPDDIAEFKGLDHISEISKHARNIFLAVIGGCVFSWLTIVTTTDVALLTNTASTPLPIIQTKVPIAGFYWAAPAILLALYFYLHMYLQRLWSGLASLPAIFPDGRTLDERAYPWLLTSLVRAHVPRLRASRPPFSQLQVSLSIVSAWVLVPVTICLFWLRYLVLHEWWIGTVLHIALVTVAVTLGASFYWHLRVTLRGDEPPDFGWRTPLKALTESKVARAHVALILCVAAAASLVSGGAIEGKPGDLKLDPRTWIPSVFQLVGYRPFLNLVDAEVSIKPSGWTGLEGGLEGGKDYKAQIARVKGAQLAGRDLRYAAARDAFLVKADLSEATLQNADLRRANLQEANLRAAKLQKANLRSSRLQGADLWKAKLQGAKLRFADLRRANLESADLQGTDLSFADLRGATGLTQEQLDRACGDEKTKLPEYLKDYILKLCPKKAN